MKKVPVQWLTVLVVFVLLLIPVLSVAAQGGGTTLYLPFVSKQTPVPNPAVKQVGPAGGTFPAVAVEPGNASTLYVGTWGLGVQKSLDGGLTWQAVNAGLGNRYIQSLAVRSDGWVYAGTYGSGVYRSQDGGASWQAINSGDALVAGLIVYDIEIDPTNTQIIYISGRTPGSCADPNCDLNGYIFKSISSGDSWASVWNSKTYFTNGDYSYDVEVDPVDSNIVYFAAHRNSVYKSGNGGTTWDPAKYGINDPYARKLLILNDSHLTVYNSTYDTGGVFKTIDGGNSWVQKASGLPSPLYGFALSRDSQNPNDIYLGTGDRGVYKSTTLAESWTDWGLGSNFIWAFAQVPGSSPALYAATSGNGLQYSSDGARYNWQPRHEGVFNTNITGLASYNSALYAGVNGGGVFKTTDRGDTWQALNSGLTNLNVQNLQVISGSLYAFTTTNLYVLSSDGVSWSVSNSVNMAPPAQSSPASTDTVSAAEQFFCERGVFPEEEQYLLQTNIMSSAASGFDGTASGLRQITSATKRGAELWFGTAGGGIYRGSTLCAYAGRTIYAMYINTNGEMLASLTGQYGGYAVIKWKEDYYDSCGNWNTQDGLPNATVVYNFFSNSPRTIAASSTGVYYLPNNSNTWLSATGISNAVYAIAADPTNANRLYAATDSGAYVSEDGGLTWSQAPRAELRDVRFLSVSFDPANSNIVYFGSREGSTYRWDKSLP